jgi:hypothetical protein
MRVFSTLKHASPVKVAADECPACGRLYPADGAVEKALALREAPTVRPPSSGRMEVGAIAQPTIVYLPLDAKALPS